MPTRTTRLGSLKPAANAPTAVFTVPAGMTYLVKSVVGSNGGGVADTVTVYAQDAAGNFGSLIQSLSVPAGGRFEWEGFQALNATDLFNVLSVQGSSYFWVSGTKLPGVA